MQCNAICALTLLLICMYTVYRLYNVYSVYVVDSGGVNERYRKKLVASRRVAVNSYSFFQLSRKKETLFNIYSLAWRPLRIAIYSI